MSDPSSEIPLPGTAVGGSPDEVDGLICAYVLDGRGGARHIDWAGVHAWRPGDGILWVHADRKIDTVIEWVRASSGIPPAVTESLLADDVRPRILRERDNVLVNLRGVNLNPGADPEDMVSIRMWIEPERIISLRHVRLMAVNDVREMLARGDGPRNQGELLVRLADRLIDRMGPVISDIDESLDELEDAVQSRTSPELRSHLLHTRHAAITLRRYLAPQRDAMSRLLAEQVSWLGEVERAYLREIADRTTRYVEDLEAARERAAATQEEFNYQASERMNRTMYVLTVVAAVMLPPSLIAGLLGINVGGMPGVDSGAAFWVVVVLIAILAVGEYLVLRRLKWI